MHSVLSEHQASKGVRLRSRIGTHAEYEQPDFSSEVSEVSQFELSLIQPGSYYGGAEYLIDRTVSTIKLIGLGAIDPWVRIVTSRNVLSEEVPLWLRLANARVQASLETISNIADALLAAVHEGGPKCIDFSIVDVPAGTPEHLVTLLRASYPWKDEIRGWHELALTVRDKVQASGLDHNRIMKGLVA